MPELTIIQIGPRVREPTVPMAKFWQRDRYPSLKAYWLAVKTNRWWWPTIFDMLHEQMEQEGVSIGRIDVPGIGTIGGCVKYAGTKGKNQ